MITHKFTTIQGCKIHYFESSTFDKSKPPLLVLSGFPIAADFLVPLIEMLKNCGKCYILDLPGFGNSSPVKNTYFGFDYYQSIIHSFQTNEMRCAKVNIFGYSTGGVHAVYYAEKYPNHVHKVISFSAPLNGDAYMEIYKKKHKIRMRLLGIAQKGLTKFPAFTPILNNFPIKFAFVVGFFIGRYVRRYPNLFTGDRKKFVLRGLFESSKLHAKAVFDTATDLSLHDFTDSCRRTGNPVLLISAEFDKSVKPEFSQQLLTVFPNATFSLIPNADHSVGITEPHKMAPHITDFLLS